MHLLAVAYALGKASDARDWERRVMMASTSEQPTPYVIVFDEQHRIEYRIVDIPRQPNISGKSPETSPTADEGTQT